MICAGSLRVAHSTPVVVVHSNKGMKSYKVFQLTWNTLCNGVLDPSKSRTDHFTHLHIFNPFSFPCPAPAGWARSFSEVHKIYWFAHFYTHAPQPHLQIGLIHCQATRAGCRLLEASTQADHVLLVVGHLGSVGHSNCTMHVLMLFMSKSDSVSYSYVCWKHPCRQTTYSWMLGTSDPSDTAAVSCMQNSLSYLHEQEGFKILSIHWVPNLQA